MKITRAKSKKDTRLKVGEIVTIDIQVGSSKPNEKIPIFSHFYCSENLGTFLVLAVGNKIKLMNLETKEEREFYYASWSFVGNFVNGYEKECIEVAKGIAKITHYGVKEQENIWKKYTAKVAVYSGFDIVKVNLNSSAMVDGQITFGFDEMKQIRLPLPRMKGKLSYNFK